MNDDEKLPLYSTYYVDMLTLKLSVLRDFQSTQGEEEQEINRLTLIGFLYIIKEICELAQNYRRIYERQLKYYKL